jgi:hypothetical protein
MTAPQTDSSPRHVRVITDTSSVRAHLLSDDVAVERTGRPWSAWFALLDGWNADTRSHDETALWLVTAHAVDGWWAQNITAAYEQARGLHRVPDTTVDVTVPRSRPQLA